MSIQLSIELLTQEWDPERGFLGKVRYRTFDQKALERLIGILASIDVKDEDLLDRRLVSLLWFIPIFLEWQKVSFEQAGKDVQPLQTAQNRIMPLLYEILGVP